MAGLRGKHKICGRQRQPASRDRLLVLPVQSRMRRDGGKGQRQSPLRHVSQASRSGDLRRRLPSLSGADVLGETGDSGDHGVIVRVGGDDNAVCSDVFQLSGRIGRDAHMQQGRHDRIQA